MKRTPAGRGDLRSDPAYLREKREAQARRGIKVPAHSAVRDSCGKCDTEHTLAEHSSHGVQSFCEGHEDKTCSAVDNAPKNKKYYIDKYGFSAQLKLKDMQFLENNMKKNHPELLRERQKMMDEKHELNAYLDKKIAEKRERDRQYFLKHPGDERNPDRDAYWNAHQKEYKEQQEEIRKAKLAGEAAKRERDKAEEEKRKRYDKELEEEAKYSQTEEYKEMRAKRDKELKDELRNKLARL